MRVETPDAEFQRIGKEPAVLQCTRARLSLLGLGGGGGGSLALSSNPSTSASFATGGVTVNNGSSGPLSQTTWLIIGGVALAGLLFVGLLFRK